MVVKEAMRVQMNPKSEEAEEKKDNKYGFNC